MSNRIVCTVNESNFLLTDLASHPKEVVGPISFRSIQKNKVELEAVVLAICH